MAPFGDAVLIPPGSSFLRLGIGVSSERCSGFNKRAVWYTPVHRDAPATAHEHDIWESQLTGVQGNRACPQAALRPFHISQRGRVCMHQLCSTWVLQPKASKIPDDQGPSEASVRCRGNSLSGSSSTVQQGLPLKSPSKPVIGRKCTRHRAMQ